MLNNLYNYFELTKPGVVGMMLFTALVGMLLAEPLNLPPSLLFAAILGIGLVSGSAAAINQVADHRIDAAMDRTRNRPLPTGKLSVQQTLRFAAAIGVIGTAILVIWVNYLTAILTVLSLIGYAVVYTRYLKYATPQNIVIGGAAGATPPLLGWTAVTNQVEYQALLLFFIIFLWTPPHFWALALYRKEEYASANVPMLPVTHGEKYTRLQIVLYTVLLTIITVLPYVTGMAGAIYIFSAALLNVIFLYYSIALFITKSMEKAMETFVFSIIYLALLFTAFLLDRYAIALTA